MAQYPCHKTTKSVDAIAIPIRATSSPAVPVLSEAGIPPSPSPASSGGRGSGDGGSREGFGGRGGIGSGGLGIRVRHAKKAARIQGKSRRE